VSERVISLFERRKRALHERRTVEAEALPGLVVLRTAGQMARLTPAAARTLASNLLHLAELAERPPEEPWQ
jgi:hypothetical protein